LFSRSTIPTIIKQHLQEKKIGDPILAFFPLYLPKDEYVSFFFRMEKAKAFPNFYEKKRVSPVYKGNQA
jgi:hypothetical protein